MDDIIQNTTYYARNEGIHQGTIAKKKYISPDKLPIAVGVQAGLFFRPDVPPLQLETQVIALTKNGELKKETIIEEMRF